MPPQTTATYGRLALPVPRNAWSMASGLVEPCHSASVIGRRSSVGEQTTRPPLPQPTWPAKRYGLTQVRSQYLCSEVAALRLVAGLILQIIQFCPGSPGDYRSLRKKQLP